MSTRAGGSSRALRHARRPTASSWRMGSPVRWSPPRRAGDERPHRRLHPAPAPPRPLAPGRPSRPGAERSHERRLDRPVAGASALARRRLPQRAPGAGDPLRRRANQRGRRRRRCQRIRGKRRSLRRRAAGRGDAAPPQRRAQAGGAPARSPAPAAHPLDERDHVLPRPRPAPRPRPHRLHRLTLGADLDLAGAVLARGRARGDGRRASRRDSLGRRLRLGGAGHRPGKQAMYCSKEEVREEVWAQLEGGAGRRRHRRARRRQRARLVPRSRRSFTRIRRARRTSSRC